MEIISLVITGLVCLLVGATVVFVIGKTLLKTRAQSIIEEAAKEAEVIKKNKLLEVKEKFLHLKADMEKQANARNAKLQSAEAKAKQRELQLNQQQQELQRKKAESDAIRANLDTQIEIVEKKKAELERLHINDIMDEAKLTANKEAKRIVIQSIQRVATETAIENSVTVFHIDSDEIKGRIIGREGRNIRALEAATGVEIIVDDTPEAIVLSAFDPVRREIARASVGNGRTHSSCPYRRSSCESKKANRGGNYRDRKTYGYRFRYSRVTSRIDQISGENEISFFLRTKSVATLSGNSKSLCYNGFGIRVES